MDSLLLGVVMTEDWLSPHGYVMGVTVSEGLTLTLWKVSALQEGGFVQGKYMPGLQISLASCFSMRSLLYTLPLPLTTVFSSEPAEVGIMVLNLQD